MLTRMIKFVNDYIRVNNICSDKKRTLKLPLGHEYAIYRLRTVNKILDDVRGDNYNALCSHTDTLDSHGKGAENFIIARKKANIEDLCFHDLRHTFATRLAHRGVDLYTII